MTIGEFKKLLENVNDDLDLCISVYSCGSNTLVDLTENDIMINDNSVIIDAEYN